MRYKKLDEVRTRDSVGPDSVKRSHSDDSYTRDFDILLQAQTYFDNLERIKKEGERCKKFYFGDAWSDEVTIDGRTMREDDYIRAQGKTPLQQNLIRRLGRNVVGVYREDAKMPLCVARDKDEQRKGDTMSELLSYCNDRNSAQGLFARSLEYFIIYGMVAHRHWYGWGLDNTECECWQDRINILDLFWDTEARRDDLRDARMMGCVHDMSMSDLLQRFTHSAKQYNQLREVYRTCASTHLLQAQYDNFGYGDRFDKSFLTPNDPTMCRVIEIWSKEQKPRYHCHDWLTGECFKVDQSDYKDVVATINNQRLSEYALQGIASEDVPTIDAEWFLDEYWYYRYLTPSGIILSEGESPYLHQRPPICIKLYPMINGTVRSFVADLIDIQKMVNRLITKYDWIMSASAQGLVAVAEESISDKMSLDEIAENWAKFNGVIVYRSRNGAPMPKQISTNATNIGIMELLNVQLKFIEDISSVSGALQGKQGYSGMSGSLYAQQTQNSTKGLLDLLETYSEFVSDNASMDVKNIQQFYSPQKVLQIAGKDSADVTINAEDVLNADYDLVIAESTNAPAYRERANGWLMQLLQMGMINLDQMLAVGKFPFGEQLQQELATQRQQMQQGQQVQPLSQGLQQQVQSGANMDAVQMLYNGMMSDNNQGSTNAQNVNVGGDNVGGV